MRITKITHKNPTPDDAWRVPEKPPKLTGGIILEKPIIISAAVINYQKVRMGVKLSFNLFLDPGNMYSV